MLNHIVTVPHLHNLIHRHAAFLFTLISGCISEKIQTNNQAVSLDIAAGHYIETRHLEFRVSDSPYSFAHDLE